MWQNHSDPSTTFDTCTLPGILVLPSAPTYLSVRVGQTVARSLPSVLEQFYLKTLSNWDAAASKRRDLGGHYQQSPAMPVLIKLC